MKYMMYVDLQIFMEILTSCLMYCDLSKKKTVISGIMVIEHANSAELRQFISRIKHSRM